MPEQNVLWSDGRPRPSSRRNLRGKMIRSPRKPTFWVLPFCLLLTLGSAPAVATAQASSSDTSSTAKPAAQANPNAAAAAPAPSSGNVSPNTPKSATGKPSASEIAAAKASGKVWVNTESRVYHKNGRWYGKTKSGKFMTEAEAKAAGYKEAQR